MCARDSRWATDLYVMEFSFAHADWICDIQPSVFSGLLSGFASVSAILKCIRSQHYALTVT